MTIEQLRKMHQAKPFEAFDIHLADGRCLRVSHPELLAVFPPGRTIMVVQGEGDFQIVDLLLVTSLEVHGNGARRSKAGR